MATASIDDARWQRVKEVFHQAIDAPEAARPGLISAACGADASLRHEVASLLECDRDAREFLERPLVELLVGSGGDVPGRLLDTGDTLGRYEILAFLGAGAASEVYRARDTRLGRTVALKLQTDADAPDAAAWLLREAQHASTLNHPHICTVHEVEEVDGRPFIVLEHIEGTTLHAIIDAERPSTESIVRWGTQIASALDHAHRRGIVHRDLKATNVVVMPAGDIKVLDFGLARRLNPSAAGATPAAAVLADASIAGTLTHVPPEAFRSGSIDARMDIWALGVMLYQMASGRLPFSGETSFATANAILDDEPAPLPADRPLALQQVVSRCLSKDPAARYQSAAELRSALATVEAGSTRRRRARRWLVAAAALIGAIAGPAYLMMTGTTGRVMHDPGPRVVAILPLVDEAGATAPSFLADGMTEALIAEIGRLDGVRVIAAATSRRFRGRPDAARAVTEETAATHVLEGSVSRANDRVRLSARLIEPATGRLVWSDEYDRHVRDLHALQGSVASAIAEAVELTVTEDDTRRLSLRRAVDPDVYEAYLKGRYHWNRRTNDSLQEAIGQFEAAIRLDPTFAPAYAALADCYNQLGTIMVGGGSPRQWRPRATEAAIKALQIDSELAEAHATLGYVRHYSGEWEAAEKSLQRALALNPSYALGRIWYANYLSSRGRAADAIREVRMAEALDPLSPIIGTNVGWVLINARRYGDAIEQLQQTIALDPSYVQAHSRLGAAYSFTHQHDKAIEEYQIALQLSGRSAASLVALAQAYGLAGRRREAEEILNGLLAGLPEQYVASGAIGNAYAALGRRDEALSWLERSFEERANNIAYLAVEPVYDPLRSEPRFHALLRQAGLP